LIKLFKFQAPKYKSQINHNNLNSKFQTHGSAKLLPHGITTGRPGLANWYKTVLVNLLVIGYCILEFVCDLVLEVWNFISSHNIGSHFLCLY